jgi:hypothetical protein
MTLEYSNASPSAAGKIHIFHINADGSYNDITSKLVMPDSTGSTPAGCMHARKAVIADFNGDSLPDVMFACHGSEASTATLEMRREYPMLLLSQPSGKYTLAKVPLLAPIYGHGATAADVNGDGKVDVVFADISQNDYTPTNSPIWVLKGNGDGTFTEDHSQFGSRYHGAAVFSIEFLPMIGSKGSLWVAGPDVDAAPTNVIGFTQSLFVTDSSGNFVMTPTVLPVVTGNTSGCTNCMSFPLDVTVKNGIMYVLRTPGLTYNSYSVQRVDTTTMTSTNLFTYNGIDFGSLAATRPECVGVGGNWIDWLRPYNGNLITDDLCRNPNIPMN